MQRENNKVADILINHFVPESFPLHHERSFSKRFLHGVEEYDEDVAEHEAEVVSVLRVVRVDKGELEIPEAAPRGDYQAEHDEVREETVDRVRV